MELTQSLAIALILVVCAVELIDARCDPNNFEESKQQTLEKVITS